MTIERHPFQFFLAGIADKLNPVEEENMIVEVSYDEEESLYIMNKTFAEIYETMKAGTPCFMCLTDFAYTSPDDIDSAYAHRIALVEISMCYKYDENYRVYAPTGYPSKVSNISNLSTPAVYVFQAINADDYPTFLRTVYVNSVSCTETTNFLA